MKIQPNYHRKLYLDTIADLEAKLAAGDSYSLLRASGLLRQLLVDGGRLVDLARAGLHVKYNFVVADTMIHTLPNVVFGMINIDPGDAEGQPSRTLDRDGFLRFPCLVFQGQIIRVIHVIKTCANVLGGVHAGKPKPEDKAILEVGDAVYYG